MLTKVDIKRHKQVLTQKRPAWMDGEEEEGDLFKKTWPSN